MEELDSSPERIGNPFSQSRVQDFCAELAVHYRVYPPNNVASRNYDSRSSEREAPMFNTSAILLYGRDKSLLNTRTMLLEREGYRVYQASDYDSFRLILHNMPIGILILCHTLSEADCIAALDTAKKSRRDIKSLILTNRPRRYRDDNVSAVISGFIDPNTILAETAKISDEFRSVEN